MQSPGVVKSAKIQNVVFNDLGLATPGQSSVVHILGKRHDGSASASIIQA